MAAKVKIEDQYTGLDLFSKMKFDLRQNIMSCGLVSSLKYISLTKIVISLWECEIIRDELREYLFCSKNSYGLFAINIVSEFAKIVLDYSCLILPTHLMQMIKEIVKIMRSEITNYFQYQNIDLLTCPEEKNKLIVHWESFCWTQEGKINQIKTTEKILENSNLNVKEKYIIACNNCLKEKSQDLFQKLPCSFITEIINDNLRKNDEDPELYRLVLFWTIYFRGKNENYAELIKEEFIDEKLINETSTYEYLLKWAIEREQDVAFQYIWENFANETEKQHLIEFMFLPNICGAYNNCFIFLCSQKFYIELKDLLRVEINKFVAATLNRISKYYQVMLVPAYVNEFIKTHEVWVSLELLKFSWIIKFSDSNEYVRIWEKFSLHFANDIRNNYTDICKKFIDFFYDPRKDLQPLKYPLKMGTFKNKIDIVLGSGGVFICVRMLCKSLKCFEQFINFLFDSEEEISQFKTLFLVNPGFNCIHSKSSLENYYELLEDLLTKFLSKDEAVRYKNELPYQNNANIIDRICVLSNKDDLLTALDKFIKRCYEKDEDKIAKCKAKLFDVETTSYMTLKEHLFRSIEDLIIMGKYELVEKCWKWIFFATEDKIISPKKKLDRIKKILYFGHRKRSEFLQMFITSCFEQCEIDELKNELMDSNMLLTLVEDIISKKPSDNFLKAENLIDWCYSSDKDAITKFKNKLLHISGIQILLKFIKFPKYKKEVKHLFEWFKPSAVPAKLFESFVIDYINESRKSVNVNVKTWTDQKNQLEKCFKILTKICKEDHAMNEKNEDKVDVKSTKRFSEEEAGSINKKKKVKMA